MSSDHSYFDVCVVCALAKEAKAFMSVTSRQCRVRFEKGFSSESKREYRYTTIYNNRREQLTIHVSWLTNPGPLEAGSHITSVFREFRPRLAIMTGICAGDRRRVKLGDLVVADRAFLYDNGKVEVDKDGQREYLYDTDTGHSARDVLHFVRMFDLWKPTVAKLRRPPSKRQQREWLLSKLLEETTSRVDTIQVEELEKHAPGWRKIVQEMQEGADPYLSKERTLRDKSRVSELRYKEDEFPFKDPLRPECHIAPMASGSAVRRDDPFKEVQIPVRGTVAIDMEGAAFYRIVEDFVGTRSLLVKGVCDYADSDKDDTYHQYASSVSALYALCFIREYATSDRMPRILTEREQISEKTNKPQAEHSATMTQDMRSKQSQGPVEVPPHPDTPLPQKDFFISYSSVDRYWAEWIAWQLEQEGKLSVILQAWDFRPSLDYIQEMQEATIAAKRTIAVLSPNYLQELYKYPAWTAAFAQNLEGKKGTLLPIRVRECKLTGLLAPIIPIDLFELDDELEARHVLLEGIKLERAPRTNPPPFPGASSKRPILGEAKETQQSPLSIPKVLHEQPAYPKELVPITKTIEVFYSYAQEDENLQDKLETHLSLLQRQGLITSWDKWMISPGQEHKREIDKHLSQAQIILLLVSANFLHSEECYSLERRAMERQIAGEARVIPVILRPTDWEQALFGKLSVLPTGGLPVTMWTNQDDAFLNIAQGIRRVVNELVSS